MIVSRRRWLQGAASLLSTIVAASGAVCAATTPLTQVGFAPDITVIVGSTNAVVGPATPGTDDMAAPGAVTPLDLGSLPNGAHVVATHRTVTGTTLFVLDTSAWLGAILATPLRVIEYNGSGYSVYFDAAAHGIPAEGVGIDALALVDDTDLLLSFDVTVTVPPGLTVVPSDLVRYAIATGTWAKFFDGVAAGVPAGLNLRDVHFFDHNRHLLMAFDGSGMIGAVSFGPDSVLEFTPPSTFELAYDGSTRDSRWSAYGGSANLVALHARSYRSVLDVDANTQFDPKTDGLLVLRHMFGYANPQLTNDAMGTTPPPLRNAAAIPSYFTLVDAFLDVDGNGFMDPLTDGVMIIRYLSGVRGSALTQGMLGNGATRTSAQVQTYINWLVQ